MNEPDIQRLKEIEQLLATLGLELATMAPRAAAKQWREKALRSANRELAGVVATITEVRESAEMEKL